MHGDEGWLYRGEGRVLDLGLGIGEKPIEISCILKQLLFIN